MSELKVNSIRGRLSTDTVTVYASAGAITTLTSSTSITIDMANSNNFKVNLAHNATINIPSNHTAGQTGSIFITQTSGSNTVSWHSSWKFAGGTAPTLSTAAGAVDRVDYIVLDSGHIHAVASYDIK